MCIYFIDCPFDQIFDKEQCKCVCKAADHRVKDDKCVLFKCPAGQKYDEKTKTCLCENSKHILCNGTCFNAGMYLLIASNNLLMEIGQQFDLLFKNLVKIKCL